MQNIENNTLLKRLSRHVVTFFGYCLTVFIRALMVI